MSRAPVNPYWGKHLKAKLTPPPEFASEAEFDSWFRTEMGKASGTVDGKSRAEVLLNHLMDMATDGGISANVRKQIIFGLFDRLGGKPMVRVHSTGDSRLNLTLVEEQTQQLFISDPAYQARVIEAETYARLAIGSEDRGDEPGRVREDGEQGPVDDAPAPGTPEPEAG